MKFTEYVNVVLDDEKKSYHRLPKKTAPLPETKPISLNSVLEELRDKSKWGWGLKTHQTEYERIVNFTHPLDFSQVTIALSVEEYGWVKERLDEMYFKQNISLIPDSYYDILFPQS
jgi:hypothetical protein